MNYSSACPNHPEFSPVFGPLQAAIVEYRTSACAYGVELPLMQQILAFDVALQLGHGDQVWLRFNNMRSGSNVFPVSTKRHNGCFGGPKVLPCHLGR